VAGTAVQAASYLGGSSVTRDREVIVTNGGGGGFGSGMIIGIIIVVLLILVAIWYFGFGGSRGNTQTTPGNQVESLVPNPSG
jgi:hypothetical protein